MSERRLLCLGAGPLQLCAIRTARAMGYRVVAMDGSDSAIGLSEADEAVVADISRPRSCLEVAQSYAVVGAVHVCSEIALLGLGLINDAMGLSGISLAQATAATNKLVMRRAFDASGAPSPRSLVSTSLTEGRRVRGEIGGDVILKPIRSSGSRGVSLLRAGNSEIQFDRAWTAAARESRDPGVLVEQYIDGRELSLEGFVWGRRLHVVALTDKVTTGPPHFVEIGHTQPASLSWSEAEAAMEAARAGVRALGLDRCPIHAEIKMMKGSPYLIEIGARLGGDFITTELVPRSARVDMVRAAIQIAVGEAPDLAAAGPSHAAAIRYLVPAPGIVASVHGLEAVRALQGVAVVEMYIQEGSVIKPLDSSLGRSGHVIAEGESAEEAARIAEQAARLIQVELQ